MTVTLQRDVMVHDLVSPLVEHRVGFVQALDPDADDRPADACEGLASADARYPWCEAVTARDERCPKDSTVVLMASGHADVFLCGGHYGVHRRGDRPLWVVRL